MIILYMTLPVTLLLVTFFIVAFLSAIKNDQFDDLETPAHSMLIDENPELKHIKEELSQ